MNRVSYRRRKLDEPGIVDHDIARIGAIGKMKIVTAAGAGTVDDTRVIAGVPAPDNALILIVNGVFTTGSNGKAKGQKCPGSFHIPL
jgi:hypothetical protein